MTTPRSTSTPRPRPPAQTRRTSSSLKHSTTDSPPPPYVFSFPTIPSERDPSAHGSPDAYGIGATHSKGELAPLGSSSDLKIPDVDDDAWMDAKSREELSGLLMKADGVIRDRERGTLFDFIIHFPHFRCPNGGRGPSESIVHSRAEHELCILFFASSIFSSSAQYDVRSLQDFIQWERCAPVETPGSARSASRWTRTHVS